MASLSAWEHERTIEEAGGGCTLTDVLSFELRRPLAAVPGTRALTRSVVAALFRHRHHRLVARHGAPEQG